MQLYVNGVAQGGALNPRYLTDTTTGGFEAGWTPPFIVTTAGSYELRFDATNATNYGTVAAPLYAVAYLDAVTLVSVPGAFANAGFESAGTWTLSSAATLTAATDAPEGTKVLSLAAAATASQTLTLPAGQYSVSLKLGKASVATGTLNLEIASNGAAAGTVATIAATTAADYRTYTTPAFTLPNGSHVVTLRGSGSSFSVDAIALNDAAPDALNSGFETPVLAAPSSATAAGPTTANPTNASWTFTGTGGLIQANAGTSNTSAPRTIAGKQYLALSGTGAVSQSLALAGGTYIAVGQIAQGGFNVLIDGTAVGKLAASTLDFREVMSAPFVVTAGTHLLGLTVDSTYTPNTPKLDEIRLLRVDAPPAVTITAPANGAVFQTGATVNITATASDPDGISALTISRTPTGGAATQLATGASSPLSTSWSNSSANGYTITASATDSTGATSSTAISIRVNANPSAVVSVSPTGPVVTSATAVTATVTVSSATDSDGTVTKIEFLQDAVVATTCTKTIPPAVAPFTCALSLPPRAAAYALTVRVTDNDGGVTTTSTITLRINTAPTVTLAAACVAPCTAPGTINLTATPSDTDGTIAKVEFYDGASLLATKTAAPWTFSHTTAAAGSHNYTAKAFDNDNASTTAVAQAITVAAPPPSVSLTAACTAPCNAPAAIALTAVPTNIVGTVSKVEFYDGATLLNTDTTSPYSFAVASVAAATHSYAAKIYVTGTTAAVATSTAQAVRVNALPTVTLTATCTAPCAAPASVMLTASPADADGSITKVEFYDGATLLATNTTAPWTFTVTSAAAGSHSYTAKVYDNSSAATTSTAQAITVTTPSASVTLTASCAAPCNAPGAVTLTAVPANVVGTVSKVEFYDGATLLNADTASPYSFAVTSVAAATHSYIAKVYVTGTTAAVATSTAQAVRVNALPVVTLSAVCVAPCSTPATVNLTAAPTDSDGTITRVEFYDGTTLLATNTASPWAFSQATAASGSHSYTAKAFDNNAASAVSTAQAVTVSAVPPSLALTASCAAPCTTPAVVTLTAVPANLVGTVSKVEFYDGATLINSDTSSPYSFVVPAATAATHSYSSKVYVTGAAAAVATSSAQAVTVGAAVPAVSLVANCTAPCAAPGTVTLTATPANIAGSISRVSFYDGPSVVAEAYSSPYSVALSPVAAGTHTYSAKAWDNSGNLLAASSTQSITVAGAAAAVTLTATCTQPCSSPTVVTLDAVATGVTDPTAKPSFYVDGQVQVTPTVLPYRFRHWPAAVGTHSYQVQVYSPTLGALIATSSVVEVTVAQPSTPAPSVSWVSPDNNVEVNALGTFVLNVAASAASGTVAGVNFFVDGALIGSGVPQGSNYSLSWQPHASGGAVSTSGADTIRTFYVTAVATDSQGVTAVASPRMLSVTTAIQFTPPSLSTSWVADTSGTARTVFPASVSPTPEDVAGQSYTWGAWTEFVPWLVELIENDVVVGTQKYGYEASAADAQGNCPALTQYRLTDSSHGLRCILHWVSPTFVLDGRPIGNYRYSVRITRSPGVIWRSADVAEQVLDPSPTLAISSPANNSTVYQDAVRLTARVSSIHAAVRVEFLEGATSLGYCILSAGSCVFDWKQALPGVHAITARSTSIDSFSGAAYTGISPVTTLTVLANAAPTVSIIRPASFTVFREPATISLAAVAGDVDGTIAKVEFFDRRMTYLGDGVLAAGTYTFAVSNVTAVDLDRQLIYARATDDRGATSRTESVLLFVRGAPLVALYPECAPCEAGFTAVNVSTNYPMSEITRIRYLRDSIEIALLTPANLYSGFLDAGSTPGNHEYRVEITTQFGETVLSAPVLITVGPYPPPRVIITSPIGGDTLALGPFGIFLRAYVPPWNYPINKVEFFKDGNILIGQGTLDQGEYVFNWIGASIGSYSIVAKATDSNGGIGVSVAVGISVVLPAGPQAAGITAPVPGAEFPAGQIITVTAGGGTIDPSIVQIELWRVGSGAGGADERLTTASGNALSYALTLPTTSTYVNLYTVALNVAGGRTKSAVLSFASVVGVAVGKSASLRNLSDYQNLVVPTAVPLTISGTVGGIVPVRVDYYIDGQNVGSSGVGPFLVGALITSVGNHLVYARAYLPDGQSAWSAGIVLTALSQPAIANTPVSADAPGSEFSAVFDLQAPATSAVTIGGVPAVFDFFQNRATVSGLPLQPGANALDVKVTLADGRSYTQPYVYSRSNSTRFGLELSPTTGGGGLSTQVTFREIESKRATAPPMQRHLNRSVSAVLTGADDEWVSRETGACAAGAD